MEGIISFISAGNVIFSLGLRKSDQEGESFAMSVYTVTRRVLVEFVDMAGF